MNEVAPARRLAAFRVLTGAFATTYLCLRLPHLLGLGDLGADRWEPPRPLAFLDGPPGEGPVTAVVLLTVLAGVAYTAGWRFRAAGPAFAVLLLAALSYRTSWGNLFHTDNLLVLHVLVVGLSPAADEWSVDARHRERPEDDVRYGFPLRLAAVLTVATYVVTGIAKLRYAGGDWLAGDTLLHQIAFDNARKEVLGDALSPFAATAVGQAWLFAPMGAFTLLVELGSPIALLGRRWAAAWSAAAWIFHVGIAALMWISFPYPLSLIAFAPFFRLERLGDRLESTATVPRLRPS